MMASAQVVETSVNTNNSPSQDYTTSPDDQIVETSVNANINNSPSQDYTTNPGRSLKPQRTCARDLYLQDIRTCQQHDMRSDPSYSPWEVIRRFLICCSFLIWVEVVGKSWNLMVDGGQVYRVMIISLLPNTEQINSWKIQWQTKLFLNIEKMI